MRKRVSLTSMKRRRTTTPMPTGAARRILLALASLSRNASSARFFSVMSRVIERMHASPSSVIRWADTSPMARSPFLLTKWASKFSQ